MPIKNLLNPRTLPLLILGFASGLPLALSGATLQSWFAAENIKITTIGLLTLVGQPYIYKFLWAPLLDRYVPPFLGRRRGWMLITQILIALFLFLMGLLGNPLSHGMMLALLALCLAFFSATQDISIDAYRTDILKVEERGLGSAFYIMAYRIAMIVSSGVALILADHYGWKFTYYLMAFLMLLTTIGTFLSREPKITDTPHSLKEALINPIKEFLSRPGIIWCIAFLIFYKLGDAFTISLSSAFLIKSLHFSLSVVGSVHKIIGTAASILGGLAGGFLLARLSLYRGLFYFGLGQALCSFLFMLLAMVGKNMTVLVITVFVDNFFSGMSAVGLLVFITGLCNHKFTAGQFALLSAISSLGRVYIGPLAGISAEMLGWTHYFFISFFVSVPGLLLLWPLRTSYDAKRLNSEE